MNFRNQKGINMITLSVAVIILIIITSVLAYNTRDGVKVRNLSNLYNDIELLDNKVSAYYIQHGDLPKKAKYENLYFLEEDGAKVNPNDGGNYYIIDLKSMEGITLNYGRDYENLLGNVSEGEFVDLDDIYIINEVSHTIYYPRGIEVNGKMYHTNDDSWTEVNLSVIPIYTGEQLSKVCSGETITINGIDYMCAADATYILKNDIDLSNICYRVDGTVENDKTWVPLGRKSMPFTGSFYGNNKTISNIYINSNEGHRGLFGYIGNNGMVSDITVSGIYHTKKTNIGGISGGVGDSGTIKNCISNVTIEAANDIVTEHCKTGGISGYNEGTIIGCTNNGKISSIANRGKRNSIGGITGYNYETGNVSNCCNFGEIYGNASGNYVDIGGIAGLNYNYLSDSYNSGIVKGDSEDYTILQGGIVGVNTAHNANGMIKNCYNKGKVVLLKDSYYAGGLIGELFEGATCEGCYSIGEMYFGTNQISGKLIGAGGENGTIKNSYGINSLYNLVVPNAQYAINCSLKSPLEMKQQSFVDLLNTDQEDSPWVIDTGINDGYPILKWQTKK